MNDINETPTEVSIDTHNKTVWINSPGKCLLRSSNIPNLILIVNGISYVMDNGYLKPEDLGDI